MNEIFHPLRDRELKRFHQAAESVIEQWLAKELQKGSETQDFLRSFKIADFLTASLKIVDLLADDFFEIFEKEKDRTNWNIFSSGLRWTCQKFPLSYLLRATLTGFKLDELGEKLTSYSGQWLEISHLAEKTLAELEKYFQHYEKGCQIASSYQRENQELVRLYSSLKTWEDKEKFEQFFENLDKFWQKTIEVFIEGPVQLYLMLSPQGFLLIFKMLSVEKLSEVENPDKPYQEIMAWHNFFHRFVEKFEVFKVFPEILKRSFKGYVRLLREEKENLRNQLPTRELKKRLIERFEKGLLFKEEE